MVNKKPNKPFWNSLLLTKKELAVDLKKLGLKKNMNLLVHSSLRRIGEIKGGAKAVMDCLLEIIGPKGTLMVPTHTWDTINSKQPVFHVNKTPSHVGYLTEAVRLHPDAVRSLHPCHSVAAIGPKAEFFTAGQLQADTPCPKESPYGRLIRDPDGYILFFGVDLEYNTCYHAVEQEVKVPGLLTNHREQLFVIDKQGKLHCSPQHRHAPNFQRFFGDMEYLLRDKGALVIGKTGHGISRLVNAIKMRKIILDILKTHPEIFIRQEKEKVEMKNANAIF